MPLSPGFRLGPYEILAPLGAGGMGEVYRARDPRLDRDVAIKILPPSFSADPEFLRRFEQEAKAAAALNHAGILAVYDVGQHEGSPYIVSELLEGETLRARMTGALPVRRAVEYALQVAQGLAAAHEKGIVHRDLKPENIFVRADGRVKILDFGLAKLAGPTPSAGDGSVPTVAIDTRPGVVMGTVGYMSPEQVRGEPADHRSDIFAFGAILYEALSGQRAFARDSAAETMTAVLREDPPDLSALERKIPPALSRIVDRCLDKSPAARFQSAHDLAFALEQLPAHSGSSEAAAASRRRVPGWLPWGLFAAATIGWITTWVVGRTTAGPGAADPPPVRFQIQAPGPVSFTGSGNYIAVSPDGSRMVLVAANASGPQMLWLQSLDSLTAIPIPDTERATQPFWSFDSRYIAFFADGKLKRIAAGGGPAQPVCDAVPQLVTGATWSRDGTILFSSFGGPIFKVPASGGQSTPASLMDSSDPSEAHMYPQALPDGRRFLFYRRSVSAERNGIYVQSVDSTDTRLVARASSRFVHIPGYLLYARDGLLLAHPFDADSATTSGDPIATGERIEQFPDTGNIVFSGSGTGVLAYRDSSQLTLSRLVWPGPERQGGGQHRRAEYLSQSAAFPRRPPRRRRADRSVGKPRRLDPRRRTRSGLALHLRSRPRRVAGMVEGWQAHRMAGQHSSVRQGREWGA
jgi:eukaryotic-like serine/threonine-protein kinase